MRPLQNSGLPLLSLILSLSSTSIAASSDDSKAPATFAGCTIHSSLSGSFYDVRPLTLKSSLLSKSAGTNESYHSRGYDYGANFTLNICGPVVEELDNVVGISQSHYANVSAFYTDRDDIYSLGEVNQNLTIRGRKLLLNYTNGSPCPELDEYGDPVIESRSLLNVREIVGGGNGSGRGSKSKPFRRKSTLLSFICDTSPALSTTPRINFVGTMDHCTYTFEIRSRYACAGATPSHEKGSLGPAGVFGMILAIGVLAYLVGGIVYQRNVMHQRGWRQLPNYGLWAGIWDFFSDMFQIILGPCLSRLPSTGRLFNSKRGGYVRVGADDRRNVGRGRTSDDENRLIDDLNEEWDD
ncbi:Cation-independent mannose-6-phosphate receptor CI-MPR [Lithohypha guttulata]|nr:Cation-independent mannose-6-phosphate receptor CI-MPR [Lithohypha guttulata]